MNEKNKPILTRFPHVQALEAGRRQWAEQLLEDVWGGPMVITRGRAHDLSSRPGFIALQEDRPVGLATYQLAGDQCELLSLNSLLPKTGVGSALVAAVRRVAIEAGCRRLWLITTNDNVAALRFYQKRGFTLAALHKNALEQSRLLKPQIPLVGLDGIPLRDEIELEMFFKGGQT